MKTKTMHYTKARDFVESIHPHDIKALDRDDPSFYKIDLSSGYKIRISPFFRWLYIYENDKLIGALKERCHERYLVPFLHRVIKALESGIECREYYKKCFIEDCYGEPCKYR